MAEQRFEYWYYVALKLEWYTAAIPSLKQADFIFILKIYFT